MQNFPEFFQRNSEKMILPLAIAAGAIAGLFIVRSIVFRILNSRKYPDRFENSLLSILGTPSFFWVIAIGLYVGVTASELQSRYAKPIIQSIHVLFALSVTIVAANLAAAVFKKVIRTADGTQVRSGLAVGIVKGTITGLGILVIFSILGISITPVLTALGVGGLAVALALKDTLENLFAGIYLITDRTIRVGDIIRLESGQDGTVDDIGWRTTRIRSFNSTTIIVPNTKLAQSIVTNYCIPDNRLAASFSVLVSIENDPSQIESIALEVLKQATEDVVGFISVPNPTVRFIPGFVPGGLEFTVSYQVREYADLAFTQHEMKKRIFQAFKERGVRLSQGLWPTVKQ